MKVFVDTSAFLALLDRSETMHPQAGATWLHLLTQEDASLFCTNYVLLESAALIQRRLGMRVVKTFHTDVTPILHLIWVDEELHRAAVMALLTANRRQLSLVDCVSFATMRQLSIEHYFGFDVHFAEQGFTAVTS